MAASRGAPPPPRGSPLTPPLGSNTTIRAIKAQPPNDPIFVSGMSPNAIRFRQTCLRAIHLSRPSTSFVINRSKTWMPATSAGMTIGEEDQMSMRLSVLTTLAVIIAAVPSAQALTPEEIVNYRGADRQQVLIDGARTEGQVVLYSALIVNQMLRPLAAGFMKKYPFIKMTYYRADSEELLAKLSAETRANNVVADVFEGSGGGEIAVEAGFTRAFYSPELATYPKTYLDPKGHLAPTRLSYFSIAYNTKQVPADKVPRTYEDLTHPQWQGKMAWPYANTGRYLFMINLRIAWGEERALAYFGKLSAQKIINFASGSARTLVD